MALLQVVEERLPLIVTTILFSVVGVIVQRLFAKDRLSNIPLAGALLGDAEKRRKAYLAGSKSIYMEGYEKVSYKVIRRLCMEMNG